MIGRRRQLFEESCGTVALTSEDYQRILWFLKHGKECMRSDYIAVKTVPWHEEDVTLEGRKFIKTTFRGFDVFQELVLQSVEEPPDKKKVKKRQVYRHPREYLESQAASTLKEMFPDRVSSSTHPKAYEKYVEGWGIVMYHPPGWSLKFKKHLRYISADDVEGAYAESLGLPAGTVTQNTVVNGSV
ncbi:unnamed protein product, partial [Symbiodinium pilosum]